MQSWKLLCAAIASVGALCLAPVVRADVTYCPDTNEWRIGKGDAKNALGLGNDDDLPLTIDVAVDISFIYQQTYEKQVGAKSKGKGKGVGKAKGNTGTGTNVIVATGGGEALFEDIVADAILNPQGKVTGYSFVLDVNDLLLIDPPTTLEDAPSPKSGYVAQGDIELAPDSGYVRLFIDPDLDAFDVDITCE